MVASGPELELTLIAGSDRFDSSDTRWLAHEADLMAELTRNVGGLRRDDTAVTGNKGATTDVILALGSAGAFIAAVECFRVWLARDRTRKIEIIWTVDGQEERVVLEATGIDRSSFERLTAAIRELKGW
ncbi:MAG: effector-associated constant component EACC1 [Pseudonocardiaceae bacterium]